MVVVVAVVLDEGVAVAAGGRRGRARSGRRRWMELRRAQVRVSVAAAAAAVVVEASCSGGRLPCGRVAISCAAYSKCRPQSAPPCEPPPQPPPPLPRLVSAVRSHVVAGAARHALGAEGQL